MTTQSDVIAAAVERHADLILKASGSALRHYTTTKTRNAILSAVMDLYEEANRAGAKFADDRAKAALSSPARSSDALPASAGSPLVAGAEDAGDQLGDQLGDQ